MPASGGWLKQLRWLWSDFRDLVCLGLGVVALGLGFGWLAATNSPALSFYSPWTWNWAWEAMNTGSDYPTLAPGALLIAAGLVMSAGRLPRRVVLVAGGIVLLLLLGVGIALWNALNSAG